MNRILKFIYTIAGWLCPECGSELKMWQGCSHTPACEWCPSCSYKVVHNGVSISSIEFTTLLRCVCGGFYRCYMHAGLTEYRCASCGGIKQ